MGKKITLEKATESDSGTLYIVSTPIGNDDDITLRAIKILGNCDILVCEEAKIAAQLLHRHSIHKPIELLNEHNEIEKTSEILKLLIAGNDIALVSDCGTPIFADPGLGLLQSAIRNNINVKVVPGASSIMTALVASGFSTNQFVYAGFLSRVTEDRVAEISRFSRDYRTVVILETPYRLRPILEAATLVMPNRRAYIGCNLTMPFETNHWGTFQELYEKFRNLRFKGEFVLVFEGAREGERSEMSAVKRVRRSRDSQDYPSREYKPRGERADSYKSRDVRSRTSRDDGPRKYSSDDEKKRDYSHREYKSGGDKPRVYKPREDKPREYRARDEKPRAYKPREDKPRNYKPRVYKSRDDKPGEHRDREEKPRDYKPRAYKPREVKSREYRARDEKPGDGKPRERRTAAKPGTYKSRSDKPYGSKSGAYKPRVSKSGGGKSTGIKSRSSKPGGAKKRRD